MNLSSFVSKDMVSVNLRASTKRAVISEIVGYVCSRRGITNKNDILQSILEREEAASTGIGDGVAIPHARLPHLEHVLFFVGISKPGIDFGAPDGKAAHIIFLFVTPEHDSQIHLKILSAIGNLEKNHELLSKLIAARSDAELFQILNFEQVQRESYVPLSTEEVFRELGTGPDGLTEEEARKRADIHGQNRLLMIGTTPRLLRIVKNAVELPNALLWLSVLVALVDSSYWIAGAIAVLIGAVTAAAYARERISLKALESLRDLLPASCRVLRDGHERRISAESIVPGDVLILAESDTVGADGRLFQTDNLRVDNSAFSGNPRPAYKSHDPIANQEQYRWIEIPSLVFAGTSIVSGTGMAVVTSTGMNTELGQIAYLTQTIKSEPSAIERELRRLEAYGAVAALIAAVVAALIAFAQHGIGPELPAAALRSALVVLIVAALPFAAVPVMTLVLAGARRVIRRRGATVRKLSSVHALGDVDVICTDKTGTLTTSEMCVTRIWVDGRKIDVTGDGYDPSGELLEGAHALTSAELQTEPFRSLFLTCVLCNNAELLPPSAGAWHIRGDATEGALLVLAAKAGFDIGSTRASYPFERRFPFDSVRKRMSSIHPASVKDQHGEGGRQQSVALVKGAPHALLALSGRIAAGGKEHKMSDADRARIDAQIDAFANDGMRVLGFAYRRIPREEIESAPVEYVEHDLVFLGLCAMVDPPRPESAEAIQACHDAGIRVVMITGEYQLTAMAVARKLGIVRDAAARVVTGARLTEMTPEELRRELSDGEVVFARVNPEHRLHIVSELKEMGLTVAATGDGIGDSPALKRADIGVAMGRRGTETSRATAEMILTEDNFAAIVSAAHVGRTIAPILASVASFITAHTIPIVLAVLLAAAYSLASPVSAAQLLLLVVVFEIPLALTLGIRQPLPARAEPRGRESSAHVVSAASYSLSVVRYGIVTSIFIFGAWLVAGAIGTAGTPGSAAEHDAIFLPALIAADIGVLLSIRPHTESHSWIASVAPSAAAALCIALLCVLVYVAPVRRLFATARLTPVDWVIVACVATLVFLVNRLISRTRLDDRHDAPDHVPST